MRVLCIEYLRKVKTIAREYPEWNDIKNDFKATAACHRFVSDEWLPFRPDSLPVLPLPASLAFFKGELPEHVYPEANQLSNMRRWVNNPQYSDISFAVEGATIYAHKVILCARSQHFRAMLTSGMREAQSGLIEGLDMTPDSLHCFLLYMYAAEMDINGENVVEVLVAANQYGMMHLQERCEAYLERGMSTENAAYMFEMAHRYQSPHLRALAMKHMLEQRTEVTGSDAYQQLSAELVDEFQQNDVYAPNCKALLFGSGRVVAGEVFQFSIAAYDRHMRRCATGNIPFKCKVVEKVVVPIDGQNRRRLVIRKPLKGPSSSSSSDKTIVSGAKRGREADLSVATDSATEGDELTSPSVSVNSNTDRTTPVDVNTTLTTTNTIAAPTQASSRELPSATSPHEIPATISQGSLLGHPDGTYIVRVTPDRKGEYTVLVTLDDIPIKGCPFDLLAGESYCTQNCYATGPCATECVLNEAATFTIIGMDKNKKRMHGGGAFFQVLFSYDGAVPNAWAQADNSAPIVAGRVEDHRDGTYSVYYTLHIVGKWIMEISRGPSHISESPSTVNCKAGPVSPVMSGTFLLATTGNIYNDEMFFVTLRDSSGNDNSDPHEVRVLIEKESTAPYLVLSQPELANVNAEVEDLKNGTFKVKVCVPAPDAYIINIFVFLIDQWQLLDQCPIFRCIVNRPKGTDPLSNSSNANSASSSSNNEQAPASTDSILDNLYALHLDEKKQPASARRVTKRSSAAVSSPPTNTTPLTGVFTQSLPPFSPMQTLQHVLPAFSLPSTTSTTTTTTATVLPPPPPPAPLPKTTTLTSSSSTQPFSFHNYTNSSSRSYTIATPFGSVAPMSSPFSFSSTPATAGPHAFTFPIAPLSTTTTTTTTTTPPTTTAAATPTFAFTPTLTSATPFTLPSPAGTFGGEFSFGSTSTSSSASSSISSMPSDSTFSFTTPATTTTTTTAAATPATTTPAAFTPSLPPPSLPPATTATTATTTTTATTFTPTAPLPSFEFLFGSTSTPPASTSTPTAQGGSPVFHFSSTTASGDDIIPPPSTIKEP
eukprot:TRINITY_DN4039_c0_g1_i1.p1 TRINITY_DN4039_c0_g1~~TRINITY_DN4039_c0_g1_i1.p1  ORF type:complete len:1051 (+),score=218.68 TRINITY_DN4039_c0_g1_i1:1899-5051(+)